jgi:hypothetical protein
VPAYKAKQRLTLAGRKVEPGEQFDADEQAVALALARGWIEEQEQAAAPERKARGKRAKR